MNAGYRLSRSKFSLNLHKTEPSCRLEFHMVLTILFSFLNLFDNREKSLWEKLIEHFVQPQIWYLPKYWQSKTNFLHIIHFIYIQSSICSEKIMILASVSY